MDKLEEIKSLLQKELTVNETPFPPPSSKMYFPITHNKDFVILSFFDWEIHLFESGKWELVKRKK